MEIPTPTYLSLHDSKAHKYGSAESRKNILGFLRVMGLDIDHLFQAPFIVSFKGLFHLPSLKAIQPLFKLNNFDLAHLSLTAVNGSLLAYDRFMMGV